MRNEQMGVFRGFQGNTNGAKHPRNLTSYVNLHRNVSGENMTTPGKSKKVPKTTRIEGYNTSFRIFPGSEVQTPWGYLYVQVVWNEHVDTFTFISRQFGFHEKWTNGVLEAFRGNANCAKVPRNVTSLVDTPRNVSRENMIMPEDVKKCPKTAKIEGY